MNERAAHVVDFVNEIRVQMEWTAVVVHALNALMVRLLMALAREDMNLVPPATKGRG
jgi:hypothetical protein